MYVAVHRRLDEDEVAERLLRQAPALVPLDARMLEPEQQPERMLAHLLEHAGRIEESDAPWASYTAYLARSAVRSDGASYADGPHYTASRITPRAFDALLA